MKPRHKKIALIIAGLAALGIAAALVFSALKKNMAFFYTPTQVLAGQAPHDRPFRLGGLVVKNSVTRKPDGMTISFIVTDMAQVIEVQYHGILPDLFKDGKGMVAQGRMGADNVFVADEVLAKHDENYMPPEAAYAIKQGQAHTKPGS